MFSAEELVPAFNSLRTRCLSQCSGWVLHFILASDPNSKLDGQELDSGYLLAQSQFHAAEFKRVVKLLERRQDQDSIGLRLLAQYHDVLRGLDYSKTDSKDSLHMLPAPAATYFPEFYPLVQEYETVDLDPLNRYIFAMVLVKAGKYKEAIRELVKSLKEFPLNRGAWKLLLGVLLRFDDSVIAPTLGALPDHWTSLLFRIELLAEMQQTEAALRLIPNISCPRTAAVVALEATVYYHHRDFDRAQALFEELRRIDPMRLETMELYSNVLFVKEDVSKLSELAHSLSQIDKFRPETLTVSGNFFAINGKHENAISQFAMALRFDISFGFAWTLIGHEFIELGNVSSAISAYTKAYESNPRDFRALYGLGRAFEMSRMPYQAILYYRKAVTVNPFDSRMWMALAECYEELMETENAIKCYQRAVCNVDSDGIAIYRLAKLYKDTGDDDRAAFCYESYAEKYISDEESAKKDEAKEAILFLANYFRMKRDHDKAELYAQRLLYDASSVTEGSALMKDIRSETK